VPTPHLPASGAGEKPSPRSFRRLALPTRGRSLDHIGVDVRIAYILDPIGTRVELTEGLAQ